MSLKKGSEVTLEIVDAAFKGKGVGKVEGIAVFVPGTAPGDVVRARIINRKKSHKEAKLLKILEPSPDRIEPKCSHANVCGGCSWQHIPYEKQVEYKGKQVRDHVERIGGLTDTRVHPALPNDKAFYYRNKMEYSFSTRRWLTEEEINSDEFVDDSAFAAGLHAPGRFDKILNLRECHLQDPRSFEILNFVRSYAIKHEIPAFDTMAKTGFFRHLVIRNSHFTDDFMVNVVSYSWNEARITHLKNELLKAFPFITTIVNNVNDQPNPTAVGRYEKLLHGPGFIRDRIGEYEFRINANAFFQTNTAQAEKLYQIARDFAELNTGDTLFDLYCGVGTLSLFMSGAAEQVVGIELADVAIKNAQKNAKENEVSNVHFVKGDMKEVFGPELVETYGRPDVLITDPPRAGMHPDVVQRLCELRVPRMVYVSCNSSTLARDLAILSEVYDIPEVQPVDMFPQTYHVEAVAKLVLK